MNELAIETATDQLGVALVNDERVLASSELLAERAHATELPGAVTKVLQTAGQKLEQLEDAFKMGVISKSTYEKNKTVFEAEMENSKDELPEMDADFKSEIPDLQNLDDDLDSLLKEVNEEDAPKPTSGKKKKTLMEELEDLEDL